MMEKKSLHLLVFRFCLKWRDLSCLRLQSLVIQKDLSSLLFALLVASSPPNWSSRLHPSCLSSVGLERLDRLAFHPLLNLVEVDLSSNALRSVPSEAFLPITRLRELDLSRNQIQSLPAKGFSPLMNLKILNLEKWVVQCSLFFCVVSSCLWPEKEKEEYSCLGTRRQHLPHVVCLMSFSCLFTLLSCHLSLRCPLPWLDRNIIRSLDPLSFDGLISLESLKLRWEENMSFIPRETSGMYWKDDFGCRSRSFIPRVSV